MPLPLSEIRANALAFAVEWKDALSERADAQSFWTDLFGVFGIKRRSVASFEEKVRNLGKAFDRIDVFYSGVMIGEHKSLGEDLTKAASQAFDYVQSLTREGRGDEVPQFIVVSDFARIVIYDLERPDPSEPVADFLTAKLHENIGRLSFLSGYVTKPVDPEDPINIRAVEILGDLHDTLEKGGYAGHGLERFLVRVLFCLFADDTGIFDPDTFKLVVEESRADGSDLGPALARFFKVLDTDLLTRAPHLPDDLKSLPHVNGQLFAENLDFADFTASMRKALLKCCNFNWSRISPAVFGSLFQSVMAGDKGKKKRRQIGAHYTSERDIMKLIRSLFLDDLQAELSSCRGDPRRLRGFQNKLARLRFLDPACGCGNFLVVTYRELRLLELEVLKELRGGKGDSKHLLMEALLKIDVDHMHGIEIEEWPARIAEVAMWLVDHQMNQAVGEVFGQPVLRLPLRKSAKIQIGNALRTDWNSVLPASECSYVLGNPPFVGHHLQTPEQKQDQNDTWQGLSASGVLDYVTCWYAVAAEYIRGSSARVAFVSTSSISQGEQPGIFWPTLLSKGMVIQCAHRTFRWESEARGKAHVHVVIIGFGRENVSDKSLWEYEDGDGDRGTMSRVSRINPYLFEGPAALLSNRSDPISDVPAMKYGNKPTDGGHLIMTKEERDELIKAEPAAAQYIRRYIGAEEFLEGIDRYCLWLPSVAPSTLRSMPRVAARVDAVRTFRLASKAETTRDYADYPTRFRQIVDLSGPFVLVPGHTSESRQYIPFAYFGPDVIPSNACFLIPDAEPFHFGVISSAMHMAWVRQFCGRLKSDYRYSKDIVYNNYPWPVPGHSQLAAVAAAAQGVLRVRSQHADQTLADLYDPLAMPKDLRDAHKSLDRAVDKCYRSASFTSERARVEYLFELHQKRVVPLLGRRSKAPRKRQRNVSDSGDRPELL
ncbi:MAG: DNA methyltransferase [Planctomycetota bacterium]